MSEHPASRRRTASAAVRTRVSRALKRALRQKPASVREQLRIARAYRLLGDLTEAARWYETAAANLANGGEPLRAIAVATELVRVSPDHRLVLDRILARYGAVAPDLGDLTPIPLVLQSSAPQPIAAEPIALTHTVQPIALVREKREPTLSRLRAWATSLRPTPANDVRIPTSPGALGLDYDVGRARSQPPRRHVDTAKELSAVTLFEVLDRPDFEKLVEAATLRILKSGEQLFAQGELATSCAVVVAGELEGIRRVGARELTIARIGPSDVVGLLGLFSRRQRTASVRAVSDSVVLEIPANIIADVVRGSPAARPALRRAYQRRMVMSFLGTSPLFSDLDLDTRVTLAGQFDKRDTTAGETVVAPGEVANGIYMVIRGSVKISRRTGAARVEEIARLERGHFFGVVAALTGRPAQASAVTPVDSRLAVLSHRAFNEFANSYPKFRELPARLHEHGLLVSKEFFVGQTDLADFPD